MRCKSLTAFVTAAVLGWLLSGPALFAQDEGQGHKEGQHATLGLKAEEAKGAQQQAEAAPSATAKNYGYVTIRGAFAPEGKKGGEGLTALKFGNGPDKFYKIKLKYIGLYQVGGFVGGYYDVEVDNNKFRLLFSNNPDTQGLYPVFFCDTNNTVGFIYGAHRYERGN